ncbi:prepronociceptin [Dunckerocampus dactyliophorus]|uniref:prepronociceptin n=1 Tax=Dunckerocampus dactyliophorus TaxID=161453 RepID=UPI002405AA7B|nr:prepronociceptin [Dunckerocampus dactyliophorus]XP_054627033.1 prepronociceptin [Dunckerocampus dactyliophorus]
MKTVVALLLLCVCDAAHADCQDDCLSCSRLLPKQRTFNTVECLFECEANASPASSWDICRGSLSLSSMPKRSQEEVEAFFPAEDEDEAEEEGERLPWALQRFHHVTQALGLDERVVGGDDTHSAPSLEDKQEHEDSDVTSRAQGDDTGALSISKRFGGFVKGRHGYKKLMAPSRSYQKRYGGFIGIRKSARKWNNQKRFSEFLKQYLGMSAHATEYNSVSEELSQQNEV